MNSFAIARASVRTTAALSPALGAAAAMRLFFETRPRMPVRSADAATHERAVRGAISLRGRRVATYHWGRGLQTVLLVHGWRGRASQFAPLVRELVSEGFQVVAFDAPAHGSSEGRRADIRDWIDAIRRLETGHGPFRAIVGHSLGAVAALTAVREGVRADAVATVAGADHPDAFLERFGDMLGLADDARRRFAALFPARIGADADTVSVRYDAAAHPLPSDVELLGVHDDGDRQVAAERSARLVAAHGDRARLLRTSGFGHARVLEADDTLDALVAFVHGGLAAVDAAWAAVSGTGVSRSPR
jgi:dienelactone hydrolase